MIIPAEITGRALSLEDLLDRHRFGKIGVRVDPDFHSHSCSGDLDVVFSVNGVFASLGRLGLLFPRMYRWSYGYGFYYTSDQRRNLGRFTPALAVSTLSTQLADDL